MKELVLIRHGQSTWNLENRVTGWVDVDLSDRGIREARDAGKTLLEKAYRFDVAMTSLLKRSIRTLWLILDEISMVSAELLAELERRVSQAARPSGTYKLRPAPSAVPILCSSAIGGNCAPLAARRSAATHTPRRA